MLPETSGLSLEVRPRVPGIALAARAGSRQADSRPTLPRPLTPIRGDRVMRPAQSVPVADTAMPVAARTIINAIALIVISLIPMRRMLVIAAELERSVLTVSTTPGGVPITRTSPKARRVAMGSPEKVEPLDSRWQQPS